MSEAKTEVKQRIDVIESSYEFFLAYAAQGRTTDEGAKSGADLREFLGKLESALDGLADTVADAVSDEEPAHKKAPHQPHVVCPPPSPTPHCHLRPRPRDVDPRVP